jgi:hypothetical protein
MVAAMVAEAFVDEGAVGHVVSERCLWFTQHDEHEGASLPFGLCRRGDLVVVRNVSCGSIGGREVRLFDLDGNARWSARAPTANGSRSPRKGC